MRLDGFWTGVAASVLSGVALYLIFAFYEGEPEVTWSSIGRFELPSEKIGEDEYFFERQQFLETFIVSNSGFQPARNVRVQYTGIASEVIVVSATGQQSITGGSEPSYIEIVVLAPRSQAQVSVFSGTVGDLRVVFDGEEIRQVHGGYLVVMDGSRWLKIPSLFFILWATASVSAFCYFCIIMLSGKGRKDEI